MDLTEAEDIKERWQEYTEALYKKDLQDPDNHDGVITHLKPDTLDCEVKWALRSITRNKASGGDRIPVVLFQILNPIFSTHFYLGVRLLALLLSPPLDSPFLHQVTSVSSLPLLLSTRLCESLCVLDGGEHLGN